MSDRILLYWAVTVGVFFIEFLTLSIAPFIIWGFACMILVYSEMVSFCNYAKKSYPKDHSRLSTNPNSIKAHLQFKPAVEDPELALRQREIKQILDFSWMSFIILIVVLFLGYLVRR